MSYREDQRKKAVAQREALFKDPGNGMFSGKERDFVLSEPSANLWEGIRFDAVAYFVRNKISWWKGANDEPTGHLLSSQIACINHLCFIRQRQDLATAILQYFDKNVAKAEIVDDGYVEFEFVGDKGYLNEKAHTRGANCTSIDAVMIGMMKDGSRKLFLIEWKYTESYPNQDKYIEERSSRYDQFIVAADSPFVASIKPTAYYYEPFYQLMRQTLLGDQCAKNHDHEVSDYLHIHVVPKDNKDLMDKITSPELSGKNIHEAWAKTLKNPDNFVSTSPERFLSPIAHLPDTKSVLTYLTKRYWE